MIEEALKAKKITQGEHDLYMLFAVNELGRKCLDRMSKDSFMDEPVDKEFSGVGFAFYDGRRSVLRDIHRTLLSVENKIKELNDDSSRNEPKYEPRQRPEFIK